MKRLPEDAVVQRRTPEFTEATMPAGLRRRHTTRAGVWARIEVHEGVLRYRILGEPTEEHRLSPGHPGVVEPEVPHEVEPEGACRFHVEFLRRPEPAGG